MRLTGALTAIAVVCTSTAAAQSANQAFECALPYRATMETLATLTVTGQSSAAGLSILGQGPSETIEFAPGPTRVFGHAPVKLSLITREPARNARTKTYEVTFETIFPHEAAIDEAIRAANTWHLGICAGTLCIRARDTRRGTSVLPR